jgi:hypothetical protein
MLWSSIFLDLLEHPGDSPATLRPLPRNSTPTA